MPDKTLVARVKERKTSELMMYAGLIRYDPANRGTYADIIQRLSVQLDACDALLADPESRPEASRILCPEYRGRLTGDEASDEEVFNGSVTQPINPADSNLSEYMLDLMDRARDVREIREEQAEAVSALKDELKACRDRIEVLTGKLEYAQEEVSALSDENTELKDQPSGPSVPDVSWIDGELTPISRLLDEVVDSDSSNPDFYLTRLDEAQSTLQTVLDRLSSEIKDPSMASLKDALGKVYVLKASVDITAMLLKAQGMDEGTPAPAEEPEPAEAPAVTEKEEDFYEPILTDDELQLLTMVDMMKSSKIDFFVDMAMSGRFNENACDDVVDFLKVDLSIIRALLSMDYHDRKSIEDNFAKILDILGDASEPKHQKMYVNSLSAQEKVMEDTYNKILARVQSIMIARYSGQEE